MKSHHSLPASVILTIPFWNPSNALLDQGFNVARENWFFNGTLQPETAAQLPKSCATAYTKSINCDPTILMSPNVDEKKSTLEDACEPECATSLLTYERGVREACAGADLKALGLGQSWLSNVISGQASILLYWKQCLRDTGTKDFCDISQSDYEIAWEAATAETANSAAISEFCDDSCLTQTVVLNAPTEENLDDIKEMCETNITVFPFIDAMQFAGLIKRDRDGSKCIGMGSGNTVRDSSVCLFFHSVLRVDELASILGFGVAIGVWVAHDGGLSFRLYPNDNENYDEGFTTN
ncbi:hypothetical protein HOY82DRAFT_667746 [Tuber indicum]|nr:hypothetical protein HOY82DRAFT_667746 [Tuber indicum]